ncbi:MAG: tripartite tricarboxylate transporter substrate binding protein [Betaproteobacteria bacterium]|nr:tripartite tricarboxylate transporter substrate binding protein [Betaproteobacteria bacterium]MBI2293108.1 tripartite tricarboxylate transporter substrate binding protein [Betaproteobacteria bacterium]MBI3056585.1 tripartite tricarboxylate transporter substrate binding protein [Betaproteobacteria bacterium]
MQSDHGMFRIASLAVVFCASCNALGAEAQSFPNRPLRFIVGFAPGGSTDIIARLISQKLTEALQQPVVVENRTGANGNIAAEATAKAPPDGHTMLVAANGLTINPSLYKQIAYNPVRDFSPITQIAFIPNVLVVHPSLPVKTVKEFIGLARARPGQLTHGSSGTGSPGHLAGEVFKIMTHVQFLHVAYKSSGQALIDLLAGNLQLAFPTTFAGMPQIKAGRVRAVGVTSLKRSRSLPDTPTIDESGVRGYEVVGFYGILAPAGVPQEIVARLNREIVKALRSPDMRERLLRDGAEPVASTSEEFRAYIAADVGKWAKVIKTAGIRFEP